MKNSPIKEYNVAWEGMDSYQNDLDCLCIQGHHDRETAIQMAKEMRLKGIRASVIFDSTVRENAAKIAKLEQEIESLKTSFKFTLELMAKRSI